VPAGRTASFIATASAVPAPRVQWQRSVDSGRSWHNVPGATTISYSFTAERAENGYRVRAVFRNSRGRAVTRAATLRVAGARSASASPSPSPSLSPSPGRVTPAPAPAGRAPQVTGQPADQSVPSGSQATLAAAASGDPAPSVQWQVSTDGGASWTAIGGATSSSFSFTAASAQNGYEYRAVFTNALGSASTRGATLTVTAAGSGESAPQITEQPASQLTYASATVAFSAAASGNPTPTVQWYVTSDGGTTWQPISNGYASTYYHITGAQENGYEYRAVFTNSAGSATTQWATLTIVQYANNWSGYVATGSGFSNVTGSWTVPAIVCSSTDSHLFEWVGIDGRTDNTVEQDGINADCLSGVPHYGAWYEMDGDDAVNQGWSVALSTSSYPVQPGDAMTGAVSVTGSNWTLALSDATQGWSFSIPITWSGPQQATAEWIVERPGLWGQPALPCLSDFGTATFTGASATDAAGSGPISSFANEPVYMFDGNTMLAAPGQLDPTGQSFSDSWEASCGS
jgi:hypothetical protein